MRISKSVMMILLWMCIWSGCGAAESLAPAAWIDFADTTSPVFRPIEPLLIAKNGTVCSQDRTTTVEVGSDPQLGRIVWWKVSEGSDPKGWATARIAFPERALGKVKGVRFRLTVPKPCKLSFDAYTNVPGPNFQEAWLAGSMKRDLNVGVNEVEFALADLGVPKIESVAGFGISGPVDGRSSIEVGFSRIDLLFADAHEAAEFELAPLKVTTDILRARGIDLTRQLGRVPNRELDRRCWQAFQLAAVGEQVKYWRLLANHLRLSDRESAALSYDRHKLIKRLQSGSAIDVELDSLQRRVDSWVDKWMTKIPTDKRRWYLGADKRFHYPDGRPFRMFAPYPFRMDSAEQGRDAVIPWDIRYLAGLGFNGIRMSIAWNKIEPRRGQLERWYVDQLRRVARECERYGLGVSVDLHFGRPDWFIKGVPGWGYEGPDPRTAYASGYHWPQAIAETWASLAKAFSDLPNTVAWEVPTNEPMVVNGPHGIATFPSLNRSWNQFLKRTYGTRENLKKAWSCAVNSDIYGLKDDEDWDRNSVRWMVVEDKPDVEANYTDNPRLWDHLRWVAYLQRSVTDLIMNSVRRHVPGAVGMMHRTIGDHWDQCPVPIDYTAIETIRGKHVCPGTHYGMAGLSAIRAASQTYASYDTEQHLRGHQNAVVEHVRLGLGICPFWFSQGGYAHEAILADDYGHMQADTAYLSIMSDWIRDYWPPDESNKPAVAVVLSTRLEAVRQSRLGEAVKLLRDMGFRVGVLNGLEVVLQPQLLKGYEAVITTTSYMDTDLLGVLQDKYAGIVLLHGSLQRDALARAPEKGLPVEMVRRGILLADAKLTPLAADSTTERIQLSGVWDFKHSRDKISPDATPPSGPTPSDWSQISVPSYWSGAGHLPFTAAHDVVGWGWYRRDVEIPAHWKTKLLTLRFGAIDDCDWVYVNGRLIGYTDSRTPYSWTKQRDYPIPHEVIVPGRVNEIAVLVQNEAADGGIYAPPVEITAESRWELTGARLDGMTLVPGRQASRLTKAQLAEGARTLALARSGDQEIVALAQHGRWYWWASDCGWMDSDLDRAVLRAVLRGVRAQGPCLGGAMCQSKWGSITTTGVCLR
jgi:hypothetical protein